MHCGHIIAAASDVTDGYVTCWSECYVLQPFLNVAEGCVWHVTQPAFRHVSLNVLCITCRSEEASPTAGAAAAASKAAAAPGAVQFKIGGKAPAASARNARANTGVNTQSNRNGRSQPKPGTALTQSTPSQPGSDTPPTTDSLLSAAARALKATCKLLGLTHVKFDDSAALPGGVGLHEVLHPGIVSVLASRATHMSGGDATAALALLGAWILEGLASRSRASSSSSSRTASSTSTSSSSSSSSDSSR